ncbi:MAG: SIMPL domain-containing protein [Gemmatimonadales bacterium]|nr:SIMPL domain-containing protein [Gemmatimonadales bacterium]
MRTQAAARRTLRPDLATLTVQISALGATPRQAGSRVAERADSLRRAFEALGIPRDSVFSASRWGWWWQGRIEVMPGQQVWHHPPPGAKGNAYVIQDTSYRARDVLELHIHDIRRVGPAIDTMLALGITDITGPQFVATNTAGAREAALREATAGARRQATAIAEASGMRLGPILSLSSSPAHDDEFHNLPRPGTWSSGATAARRLTSWSR